MRGSGWVPFRIEPKMPVGAYQTYQSVRPRATHSRPATCRDVDCQASLKGWRTKVDVSSPLGRKQAEYIRLKSGRSFSIMEAGDLVTFTFPPGQRCFAEHRINIERPTLYVKQGGDWRARTSEPVRMRDVDWIDDFANHQSGIADRIERG